MMLAFVIRLKDERGETFYKSPASFTNEFIIGSMLEEAKVYMDKEDAKNGLTLLEKFVTQKVNGKSIEDHIKEVNSKYDGFDIVDITFDTVHYVIKLDIEGSILYVKSIEYTEETPVVSVTTCEDLAERFFSRNDAKTEIATLELNGFGFHQFAKVEDKYEGVKLF
jgi:hypothetical protein